jgi:hypothetical protein
MKNKNWIGSGLLCGSLLAFAGCATPPPPKISPPPQLAPLKLYWDGRDNYTTATGAGERNAKNHGYSFVRVEGYVFASPQPGTVALQQYWSARRHDHWLLARNIPANVEKNGAYKFQRIEGYVYTNAQPGTVELKLFSRVRGDNFTFTTAQAETDARTAGYARRRLFRAYVLPPAEISGVTTQMFNGAVIMSDKGIVLQGDDRLNTPNTFRPPVEITIVAKTDSTNLRLAYAADQVIFNWEVDRNQLRVDGGPASGQHKAGAGSIPAGQFVTIRWLVTPSHQAIYVDDGLRFEHTGDYSNINRCVSVFPAGGSKVTVKSIVVKPLPPSDSVEDATAPPSDKVEAVSAGQIQKWIAQLNEPDFSQRNAAVSLLAKYSPQSLPALEDALKKETDTDRRWWIQAAIQACEQPARK